MQYFKIFVRYFCQFNEIFPVISSADRCDWLQQSAQIPILLHDQWEAGLFGRETVGERQRTGSGETDQNEQSECGRIFAARQRRFAEMARKFGTGGRCASVPGGPQVSVPGDRHQNHFGDAQR